MSDLFFTANRRRMLSGVLATFAAPVVLRAQATTDYVTVETASGRLRGQRSGAVNVFKGVAYGDSVSGVARFKPARPAPSWSGVRDALSLGTPSLQDPSTVYGRNEPAPGEDCLVLNVWAPAGGGGGRPVMFYSHGGGFTTGSGGSVTQDGAALAREYDVVVVATNHRLGLLGYLYLGELGGEAYAGSGNQGLSDIVLALDWTRRNISAFGGDPDNIMIFGESGGGAKTSCLYAMPGLKPMFAKAAIQSGPAVRVGSPEVAAQTTRMVLEELGLSTAEWRRLLDVPGAALLKAQAAVSRRASGALGSNG
jgi:para-nitrobenzyl esterase